MSIQAAATVISAGSSVISGTTSFFVKYRRVILALLALAVLYYLFKPQILRLFGLLPPDASMRLGGGDVYRSFYDNRMSIVKRLRDGLTSTFFTSEGRCQALAETVEWNDNQLTLIHNEYKNRYGSTLYADVSDVSTDDCSLLTLMLSGYNDTLKARLLALDLV